MIIHYLLAKNTADDHMWPAIQKKIEVLNEVGLDQNFDLNQADMSCQLQNQETLDDFFKDAEDVKLNISSAVNSCGNVLLQNDSESFKTLLDLEEDAFNDINLDNIV